MASPTFWQSLHWPAEAEGLRLDVVIPMLNEVRVIQQSVNAVCAYLEAGCPLRWRIVIADNGSTDGTSEIARSLATQFSNVNYMRLDQRGRGRALRTAWTNTDADIVSYMDVDLSTDLDALPFALSAILNEGYDVAVGSRLLPESRIRRSPKREIMSQVYNFIVHKMLRASFSDAQCGFKILTCRAARKVLPLVKNENWFFDTELLAIAENLGFRIASIPVVWDEDRDTRVDFLPTVVEDIRGVLRVRRELRSRQFVAIRESFNPESSRSHMQSVKPKAVSDSSQGPIIHDGAEF